MIKKIINLFKRKPKEKLEQQSFISDEFYSIIKLVSGEEVFSLICIDDNDDDPVVVLDNPIVIKMVQNQHGMYIKVKPWIEMSTDDIYIIKADKIITMTETTDERLISLYNSYINDEDSPDGGISLFTNKNNNQVKLSSKMGYISSVEDARKNLEKLFEGPKDEWAGT